MAFGFQKTATAVTRPEKQIILTFIYSSTCFGRFPTHHQELSGSLWFYLHIVVTIVLCWHHDTKVKPEAATVVIELMMGGKMPETC
jgi:hypothetical protein